MDKIYIYGIVDPNFPDVIRYVGKTKKSITERLKQHIYLSKKNIKRPRYLWIKKLNKNNSEPKVILS